MRQKMERKLYARPSVEICKVAVGDAVLAASPLAVPGGGGGGKVTVGDPVMDEEDIGLELSAKHNNFNVWGEE